MAEKPKFKTMWETLGDCIPTDHCEQVGGEYFLKQLAPDSSGRLLDHGCGAGELKGWLAEHLLNINYIGIDIELSPEVSQRSDDLQSKPCFHTYDGTNIPLGDDSFDYVYSHDVFEHVRHPDAVIKELFRVLKPGGLLMASQSYLYPYHSYSIFNITPYGWHTLLTDHGFKVLEFRPGMDAIASIVRGYNFNDAKYDGWFADSPFNRVIERNGREQGQDIQHINMRKIMNTGTLYSLSQKPDILE